MDDPLLLWLPTPHRDPRLLGGKAASLALLAATGAPVPPAFVLTATAYRRFHESAGVDAYLEPIRRLGAAPPLAAVRDACRPLLERVSAASLPEDVVGAVRAAFARLASLTGATAYAARSSATAEDSRSASFAGLYETRLGLRTPDDLLEAVKRCYVSLWGPRAVQYRLVRGIGPEEAMAVVVMPLVAATASGVVFTRHPLDGSDRVVVEAAWGLGEAIVSGRVTPDRYVVDRDGRVLERHVAAKGVMARCADGTVELVEAPPHLVEAPSLDDGQLWAVVQLALRIERLYGLPVDMEFAIAGDGQVVALQARPVTV